MQLQVETQVNPTYTLKCLSYLGKSLLFLSSLAHLLSFIKENVFLPTLKLASILKMPLSFKILN